MAGVVSPFVEPSSLYPKLPPVLDLTAQPTTVELAPAKTSIPVPPPLPPGTPFSSHHSEPAAPGATSQPAIVPNFPGKTLDWWRDVQLAAVYDAAATTLSASTSRCQRLATLIQPWQQVQQQITDHLSKQVSGFNASRARLLELVNKLQSNRGVYLESIQTIFLQLDTAIRSTDQNVKAALSALVRQQYQLFQSLLQGLRWQRNIMENRKMEIGFRKQQLHEQLPPVQDPMETALLQAGCPQAIRELKERYFYFLQQLPDAAASVQQALLLTASQTDAESSMALLYTMFESLDSLDSESGLSQADQETVAIFRQEMQQLLQHCGQLAAANALKLATIQDAHQELDQLAEKLLDHVEESYRQLVNGLAIQTVRQIEEADTVARQQLADFIASYLAAVDSLLEVLKGMTLELLKLDGSLFTQLTHARQAVTDLARHGFIQSQAQQSLLQLLQAAEQYRRDLAASP